MVTTYLVLTITIKTQVHKSVQILKALIPLNQVFLSEIVFICESLVVFDYGQVTFSAQSERSNFTVQLGVFAAAYKKTVYSHSTQLTFWNRFVSANDLNLVKPATKTATSDKKLIHSYSNGNTYTSCLHLRTFSSLKCCKSSSITLQSLWFCLSVVVIQLSNQEQFCETDDNKIQFCFIFLLWINLSLSGFFYYVGIQITLITSCNWQLQ